MPNIYDTIVGQEAPAAAANDPYGTVLDDEARRNQQRTRSVFEAATKVNPDQAAESQRLSKDTGLPPDMVLRNLDEVRRRQQAQALDLIRMAQDSPVLARQPKPMGPMLMEHG